MKKNSFILLAFSLLLSWQARADGLSLADQLRPFVRTTTHAFYTYNYIPRGNTNIAADSPLNMTDSNVYRHLYYAILGYWNPNGVGPNEDAQGLYASDDPISSRPIGGTDDDWLLFRIEIPVGHKYLDLRAFGEADNIPADIQAKIAQAGCPGQTNYRNIIRKAGVPACRQIAINTLRDLNVDSYFYYWSWYFFKHCPSEQKEAVVFLTTTILQPDLIQGFSSYVPTPDPLHNDRMYLENLLQDVSRQIAYAPGQESPFMRSRFWPDIPYESLPNLGALENEHMWGCGN